MDADEIAHKAVKQVFAILGVNIDEPIEVSEFQADLRFGRTLRNATNKGFVSVFALVCTSLVIFAGLGIKATIALMTGK